MNTAPEHSYHYHVIRRAIDVIDAQGGNLRLDDLASEMRMSPTHFQRVFSQWAGISPKRYQQYLALDHAKALLAQRFTTLGTAHELGLSGSGRLHDLFLRWDAMSPGAFARRGDGLCLRWGRFDSPFGPVIAMGTDKGLCAMGFTDELGDETTLEDLKARWPRATFSEDPSEIAPWVRSAFGTGLETPVHLIGAPFQIKVWEALLHIPSGRVTTYAELARAIGAPRAVRAVGTAVGRNPVSFLIPCHRALRKSGGLGGYHWGLPVKRAILAWESARTED
ncbi:methylated-DNA--[protein]-cysteine S-methyltransferase [Roseovarius sp. SYSU LYC5161]|uniref:methylated-DNA--[protein]-cysteine S-methyltransferase n=1 Tax=Roseovarius halophilus (ex Wu et al. 2025) TaxID=3376060 RepID=UPI0028712BB1|nr:bifunctional helix-turn-helix domain-containing protein/methylated-DNA--[protein]-cysteine S-methyltransferase [Roseovarius sp.]